MDLPSVILLFTSYFSSIYLVRGDIPPISMTDVLQNINSNCIVVLISNKNGKLRGILDEIRQQLESCSADQEEDGTIPGSVGCDPIERPLDLAEFQRPVIIGEINGEFKWTKTKRVESFDGSNFDDEQPSLVIFPQTKKDRSCLILPSKKYPKANAYSGPHSKKALLEFINVKCNAFLGVNGGLSFQGLHRQSILENLYSLHSSPKAAVSMLDFHMHKLQSQHKMKSHSHTETFLKEQDVTTNDEDVKVEELDGMTNEESNKNACLSDAENSDGNCDQSHSNYYKARSNSKYSADELTIQRVRSKTDQSENPESIPKCNRIPATYLTKEIFFSDYLKRSRPFILSGGAANWPAISKWTSDFLLREYGDQYVHIKLAPNGVFEGVEPAYMWEEYEEFEVPEEVRSKLPYPDLVVVRPATQNISFSEFLQMIKNSNQMLDKQREDVRRIKRPRVSAYLEYSSIPAYFPKLEEDVEEPAFVRGLLNRRQLNIWLSDGNTLGKLHFDPFDNLLCQLKGRKELILFEPHNNTQLYEAHIPEALLGFDPASQRFRRKRLMDSTSMVMAPVDISKPDFKRFPEFANARPLNCTIDEGDILFMPAFWWHEVQSYPNLQEGRNVAVNFWYEPFLRKEFPCPECKLDINPLYRHLL